MSALDDTLLDSPPADTLARHLFIVARPTPPMGFNGTMRFLPVRFASLPTGRLFHVLSGSSSRTFLCGRDATTRRPWGGYLAVRTHLVCDRCLSRVDPDAVGFRVDTRAAIE